MMHLTSEQMETTLGGRPSEETARHLADCPRCAGELAALREVFGDLREATAASAEHHRRLGPTAGVRAEVRRLPRMAWAMVTAAVFVAAAAPLVVHFHQGPRVVRERAVAASYATISDEALLAGIQNDLSTSVPASMLPLAGASPSTTDSAADSTAAQRRNP